jgi:hypothetical protein
VERSALTIRPGDASALATEVANARAVQADIVMIDSAEASAATPGSKNYDPAWDAGVQAAHTQIHSDQGTDTR